MRAIATCSFLVLTLTLAPACGEEKDAGADSTPAASAEGAESDKAGAESAAADKAAAAEPAKAGDDADLNERCGKAFDNLMAIMVKEGAPAPIVEQMKGQRDKTITECMRETRAQPDGNKALDCMTQAKSQGDIVACTQKFAKSGPPAGTPAPAPGAPAAVAPAAAPAAAAPAAAEKPAEKPAE